eukprot:COSAG04_NODE_3600_length_2678_cov_2.374564_4_plen_48_part_01
MQREYRSGRFRTDMDYPLLSYVGDRTVPPSLPDHLASRAAPLSADVTV